MITLIIIAITSGISILTMNDQQMKNRFMFNAYAISHHREWWRFFTHGLLHANFQHLIFNMLSFYLFGNIVESAFCKGYSLNGVLQDPIFGMEKGILIYLLLYISALFFSSLYSYFKQRNDKYYNALGASGAVSAVIFASILISPLSKMGLMLLPIMFPAVIFGPVYLLIERYFVKRLNLNVGSDAHIFGAIYGFLFLLAMKPELWLDFFGQIRTALMYTH
jgi:membrane associated rhomboid family serine protease